MSALDGLGASIPSVSPGGSPPAPPRALPADVRKAGKDDQDAYRAALGFEKLLVSQLVGTMAKDGPLSDGPYAGTMQDSLSDALEAGGGLGLARAMFEQMRGTGA
jgi:Rod binding domain-containing protein